MKIIFFFLFYLIFSIAPAWGKNIIATEENWGLSSSNNLTLEGSIPLFDSKLDSRGMAITADGLHAYGTSFISMWPPEQGGFIRWYRINPKDGSLTSQGVMLVYDVPTGIALSPNGKYAYVSTVNGYVKRYQINQNFSLTYIDQARHSSNHWTGGIAISPNGHAIYTSVIAGFEGGYINYFKINEDGSLTFQRSLHTKDGHQTGVCVSPNGKFVYSSGEWGVNWYVVNADDSLSYRGNARGSNEYVRNEGIGISPNGRYIFSIEYAKVRLWKVNEHDGSLVDQGLVTSNTSSRLQAVTVTPNGKFIYVPAKGEINWYSDRQN